MNVDSFYDSTPTTPSRVSYSSAHALVDNSDSQSALESKPTDQFQDIDEPNDKQNESKTHYAKSKSRVKYFTRLKSFYIGSCLINMILLAVSGVLGFILILPEIWAFFGVSQLLLACSLLVSILLSWKLGDTAMFLKGTRWEKFKKLFILLTSILAVPFSIVYMYSSIVSMTSSSYVITSEVRAVYRAASGVIMGFLLLIESFSLLVNAVLGLVLYISSLEEQTDGSRQDHRSSDKQNGVVVHRLYLSSTILILVYEISFGSLALVLRFALSVVVPGTHFLVATIFYFIFGILAPLVSFVPKFKFNMIVSLLANILQVLSVIATITYLIILLTILVVPYEDSWFVLYTAIILFVPFIGLFFKIVHGVMGVIVTIKLRDLYRLYLQ